MKFKIHDKVKCPHKQEGIIVGIATDRIDWFPYRVRITKATLANEGDIEHYKEEQLELIERVETNKYDIYKLYDFSKAIIKCDNENNPPNMLESRMLHIDVIVPHFCKDSSCLIIPKEVHRFMNDAKFYEEDILQFKEIEDATEK